MADADEGNDPDKEDQTITRGDRTSDSIATSDRSNDSYGDGRTPYILPTTEHEDVASRDDRTDNTTATYTRGDSPVSNMSDGGHTKVQNDRTSDTISTTDRGADSCMDVRTQAIIHTSIHSDGPSNNDRKPDTKATSDHGGYSSSTDGRAPHSPDTSTDDQTEDTRTTNTHGDLAVSNVDKGAALQQHNEFYQLRHKSNLSLTSKGDGPILVGKHPTIVYNLNDDGSQAVEDSKQEIMEAVVESEERLTNRIEKLSQHVKGAVSGKQSVHASDQRKGCLQDNHHWMMKQKEMMNAMCDMSARQQQAMGQQEEMHTKYIEEMNRIRSATKNENVDLTEQRNIIGHTENWITEQQQNSQFVTTKAFAVAKEKIKEKRYVVIRGDSGAGKTRLAIELLDWLHSLVDKHKININCKDPIRLPGLQNWDNIISTNSNLSILLDDVLGYSSDVSQDLTWWKQHSEVIKPIVVGGESANYLIITLRNDIYNEYKSQFGYISLFDDDNVIDLSSPDYNLEEERTSLLRVYTQSITNFQPFSESEINQIVDYSPAIGFPECCRLFKITPELQRKRIEYFLNPLESIRTVIKERFDTGKQTALLYLLLSPEPVSTKRLDFQNDCFDKEGIAQIFRISAHVFPDSANNTDSIGIQRRCLQQGLDVLCNSLVRKENGIYSFFHDSIRDTIAILYGEVTSSGFLINCPSSCLHYVATHHSNDTSLCKVMIEEDIYGIAYQRILSELESKQHSSYMAVASMSPWNDEGFLARFLDWFLSKGLLPEDYFIRRETGEPLIDANKNWITDVQLNIEGDNSSCFLIYAAKLNSVGLLKALVNILNMQNEVNHMKHALDVAISAGNVECSTYLLQHDIEPDDRTCFCSARGGNVDLMKMLAPSIKTLTVSQIWYIACEASAFGRYEICIYLLGLFPLVLSHRDRHDRHLLHSVASGGSVQCFTAVANTAMQGCQSDKERELFIKSLTNTNGYTVLHYAFSSKQREMMLYLMKEYPYLSTQHNSKGVKCISLIAAFCTFGILTVKDVVGVIKRFNQDDKIESLIDEDSNILHSAAFYGHTELCIHLIQMCPSLLMLKNRHGFHCLHMIANFDEIECFKSVSTFVFKGKTKEESKVFMETLKNENGVTVLHQACISGQSEICVYLTGTFPSMISQKDRHENHCLHMIAHSGKVECFKLVAALVLKDKTRAESERFVEKLLNVNGFTILHQACVSGQTEMCLYLIREFPAMISQTDRYGMHCLHGIADSGEVECFKSVAALVLKDKTRAESETFVEKLLNVNGFTVLHQACAAGRTEMCVYLMGQFPSMISQKDRHQRHCLHLIARSGQVECFKLVASLLLKGNTKAESERFMNNLIDEDGSTVLHQASLSGKTEMCLYLIKTFPTMIPQTNLHGCHLLHLIAQSGQVDCFKLIAALVLKDQTSSESERFMETLKDETAQTVLHHACLLGQTEMCVYLIKEYPTMILQKGPQGTHLLHMISQSGNMECFKLVAYLLRKDKTKDEIERSIETLIDEKAFTVLHHACLLGRTDMCLHLIKTFPTMISQKGLNGVHCLHLIAQSGQVECFKKVAALLLKDKTRAESECFMEKLINEKGVTVLHQACISGKTEMCVYLMGEFPKMISQKCLHGHHCLHLIAQFGHVECFELVAALVLEGKNRAESKRFMENLIGEDGSTVLHEACLSGKTEMCLYLIREFPSMLPQTVSRGCHCLHLIARSGQVDCFRLVAALALKGQSKAKSERFMETLISNDGKSVLHHACVTGKADMCLYLLREFRSISFQNGPLGSHCLHLIATSGQVCCFQLVAPLFLTGKTQKEVEQFMVSLTDDYGQTVLHHACVKGHKEMCLHLAGQYPSLLFKKNRYGSHSLHFIAKSGHVDCFKSVTTLLLKGTTKIEGILFIETLTNNNGQTVLHKASVKGKTEMCLYLINEFPSLLSKRSRYGDHCLHYIAESGQVECFKSVAALVLKGKDEKEGAEFVTNMNNKRGKTVFDKAGDNRQILMCQYLKDHFPFLN